MGVPHRSSVMYRIILQSSTVYKEWSFERKRRANSAVDPSLLPLHHLLYTCTHNICKLICEFKQIRPSYVFPLSQTCRQLPDRSALHEVAEEALYITFQFASTQLTSLLLFHIDHLVHVWYATVTHFSSYYRLHVPHDRSAYSNWISMRIDLYAPELLLVSRIGRAGIRAAWEEYHTWKRIARL